MTISIKKLEFVLNLRTVGIINHRLLETMEKIPREAFISKNFKKYAYDDIALPIDCSQTITKPTIVGLMTEALDITKRCKILEIGTGSGYQTAILAYLGRRVYSVELQTPLHKSAKKILGQLKINNVTLINGNGVRGLEEQAPFDRIIVTAAIDDFPKTLLNQLKNDGVLVAPIGTSEQVQTIIKVSTKDKNRHYEEIVKTRFLPLTEKELDHHDKTKMDLK